MKQNLQAFTMKCISLNGGRMFSYRYVGGSRNLIQSHHPGKNTQFHLIWTEMAADILLSALMFIKTNLIVVMNHSEAQVFWKVRYKI